MPDYSADPFLARYRLEAPALCAELQCTIASIKRAIELAYEDGQVTGLMHLREAAQGILNHVEGETE